MTTKTKIPPTGTQKDSTTISIQTTLRDFVHSDGPESDSNGNEQFQVVKKRKASDSPEQSNSKVTQSSIKNSKSAPITVKNQFTPLLTLEKSGKNESTQPSQSQKNPGQKPVKEILPPPIFIKEVTNFTNPENFTTKALANRSVKVLVSNVDEYRKLVTYLHESKTCFYTY